MSASQASIAIRRTAPQDAPALTAIAFAAKRHWGYPEKWIEQWRGALTVSGDYLASCLGFAAFAGKELVGFCTVVSRDREAKLDHLWVAPAWMRRGIGRQLFACAEEAAKEEGARKLLIESDPHAEAFYQRMGAITIDRTPATIDGNERFLPVLAKELQPSQTGNRRIFSP